MKFEMIHRIFNTSTIFSEHDAPDWLTCANIVKGSTLDSRWFWNDCLQLEIGHSLDTDFQTIIRIE